MKNCFIQSLNGSISNVYKKNHKKYKLKVHGKYRAVSLHKPIIGHLLAPKQLISPSF